MNIVRNLGDRYKVLSGLQTAILIEETLEKEGCPLSDHQKRRLRDSFGNSGNRGNLDMPFIAYAWEEEKPSGNIGWRISAPFMYLYAIIMSFIIQPIKWVLTGKYYWGQKSPISRFGVNWYNKVTNRRW